MSSINNVDFKLKGVKYVDVIDTQNTIINRLIGQYKQQL